MRRALACASVLVFVAWTAEAKDPGRVVPVQASAKAGTARRGSGDRPFAFDSLWNSRPVAPVLGNAEIPPAQYAPLVTDGGWSTGVFVARRGDLPVTVRGHLGTKGLWNPDAHAFYDVTIPRWPTDVAPAVKSDGHADIVDSVSGIIHSFWQLRYENGQWRAAQYAWSRIDGTGWADPAHYFQGARASGVPSMAGLIRKHEAHDGAPMYRHALAISLAANGLSASPAYVFPATSADRDAAHTNSGHIPEGALLMLPPSFDTAHIADARIRKIAKTLKIYGAYVVDRNEGTPFVIFAEIGSGLDLHRDGWNAKAVDDLERIRIALRPMVSSGGWISANGRRHEPKRHMNILSMRGPWHVADGPADGAFDSWSQSVKFTGRKARTVLEHEGLSQLTPVAWAVPKPGEQYRLKVEATEAAALRFRINDAGNGDVLFDSGELHDAQTREFVWPAQTVVVKMYAVSGKARPSMVRGILVRSRGRATGITQLDRIKGMAAEDNGRTVEFERRAGK